MRIKTSVVPKRFLRSAFQAAPAALILIALNCARSAASDFLSLETGMLANSNITNAANKADRLDDTAFNFTLSGGRLVQLGPFNSLTAGLAFEESLHREYNGLTAHTGRLSLSWWHKFGIGPRKPVLTVGASVSGKDSRYSDLDEIRYETEIRVKERLSGVVDVTAAMNIESHRAGNRYFDGGATTLSLTLGMSAPADARVELGCSERHGDSIWYISSPGWMRVGGFSGLYDMYYITWVSRTRLLAGTVFYPVGPASSVYAGFETRNTTWDGLSYPNNIVKLGFNHAFR